MVDVGKLYAPAVASPGRLTVKRNEHVPSGGTMPSVSVSVASPPSDEPAPHGSAGNIMAVAPGITASSGSENPTFVRSAARSMFAIVASTSTVPPGRSRCAERTQFEVERIGSTHRQRTGDEPGRRELTSDDLSRSRQERAVLVGGYVHARRARRREHVEEERTEIEPSVDERDRRVGPLTVMGERPSIGVSSSGSVCANETCANIAVGMEKSRSQVTVARPVALDRVRLDRPTPGRVLCR